MTCDPSDEQAQGCNGGIDSGCSYSPSAAIISTCQPFIKNPEPGQGLETFRMRLVNITAPPKLTLPLFQALVITIAVDLPPTADAGGAACGENGQGYMNWLLSVDKSKGTVLTGGAPPSANPFGTGYCYENGMVGSYKVASVSLAATFTGNTFSTEASNAQLNVPIFLPPGNIAVVLPIRNPTFHDVTISESGDCIGSLNPNAAYLQDGICQDTEPEGPVSCARWHAGGTFGGYITLKDADDVYVFSQHESLCVLLLGTSWADDAGAFEGGVREKKCVPGAFSQGDYSSTKRAQCSGGDDCDSVWLAVQFAASAVKVTDGEGVSLCHGGSVAVDDAGHGS